MNFTNQISNSDKSKECDYGESIGTVGSDNSKQKEKFSLQKSVK